MEHGSERKVCYMYAFNRCLLETYTIATINSLHMSRSVTKPTKWHVRPAKTQISLGIRPVWSESSLCAQWVAKERFFMLTAKTLISLSGCPGWSESSLGAHIIFSFVVQRLIFLVKIPGKMFASTESIFNKYATKSFLRMRRGKPLFVLSRAFPIH